MGFNGNNHYQPYLTIINHLWKPPVEAFQVLPFQVVIPLTITAPRSRTEGDVPDRLVVSQVAPQAPDREPGSKSWELTFLLSIDLRTKLITYI